MKKKGKGKTTCRTAFLDSAPALGLGGALKKKKEKGKQPVVLPL
jgi:hypothetical protein